MAAAVSVNSVLGRMADALQRWVLDPVASVKDPIERRRSRLFSILILCQFVLFVGISLVYYRTVPDYRLPLPHQLGTLVWLVLYAMSRLGRVRTAVGMLLPLYPLMAILNIAGGQLHDIAGTLALLIPSYVLASVFLSPLGTAIYGLATNAVLIILPMILPGRVPDYSYVIAPVGAGIITVTLLLVAMWHRDALERERQVELTNAYNATLEGWARALEFRDRETEGHSRRVADLAVRLARACGMRGDELETVYRGALLHDIGKMALPDSILTKHGELTEDEKTIMQTHPRVAVDLLGPASFLRSALTIPAYHHERWDGTGYPYSLQGEDIPLAARIFIVVDTWDALLSDRPYRKAWTREQAIKYLQRYSGTQFDPRVVRRFLEIIV